MRLRNTNLAASRAIISIGHQHAAVEDDDVVGVCAVSHVGRAEQSVLAYVGAEGRIWARTFGLAGIRLAVDRIPHRAAEGVEGVSARVTTSVAGASIDAGQYVGAQIGTNGLPGVGRARRRGVWGAGKVRGLPHVVSLPSVWRSNGGLGPSLDRRHPRYGVGCRSGVFPGGLRPHASAGRVAGNTNERNTARQESAHALIIGSFPWTLKVQNAERQRSGTERCA